MNGTKQSAIMDIKDFWDLTRPASFKAVTAQSIENAERELNAKLPKLLIELLKIKNGGSTNTLILHADHTNVWQDGSYELDEFYGINDAGAKSLGILSTAYLTAEWELPEKQIILTGDGNWWITLDYRRNLQEPTVNWIEPEADRDEIIAINFEAFIANMNTPKAI
jgi:hypothetical protein